MREKFPSELADRFQVRMPEGLRERLRKSAESSGVSMNTEIVMRLEASLGPANPTYALDPARERLKRAVAEMKEALAELELAEAIG